LIEEMVERGSCDFVADFGILYPTEIFLSAIGLPVEDGATFVGWVEAIFGGFFDLDRSAADQAAAAVTEYFEAAVADREKSPRDPDTDFVSFLLGATIDGAPLPREDAVTICLTIMLAGLDTTRSALGYIFHHLATHDADRHRLLADPEVLPRAIEEFLRLYSLLIQDGRYVAEDVEFHGCPMTKGDMVSLGIVSANRDPRKFERADEFVMDRAPNPHIAFGLGPHRCLGMHLARRELTIAVEEWHARIPNYRLAEGAELIERGGQLSLTSLPLEWDTGA
jgi:cytochrome P450